MRDSSSGCHCQSAAGCYNTQNSLLTELRSPWRLRGWRKGRILRNCEKKGDLFSVTETGSYIQETGQDVLDMGRSSEGESVTQLVDCQIARAGKEETKSVNIQCSATTCLKAGSHLNQTALNYTQTDTSRILLPVPGNYIEKDCKRLVP